MTWAAHAAFVLVVFVLGWAAGHRWSTVSAKLDEQLDRDLDEIDRRHALNTALAPNRVPDSKYNRIQKQRRPQQ